MDSIKPISVPTKTKLSKTFHKLTRLKSATKSLSNNGFCLLIPQNKYPKQESNQHSHNNNNDEIGSQNRAAMEAFTAKLFATVAVLKAAYAELQMAQFPYNGDAIQVADQEVVDELRNFSELKRKFLSKEMDSSSNHVTLLLSEIQEQQSLIKMYEITMRKMESEIENKEVEICLLEKEVNELDLNNKSMEKRLNSSGCFSVFDNLKISDENPNDFVLVLDFALRAIRNFVKLLIKEMENANWDIEVAANAIGDGVKFPNAEYRGFAFEAFVCREMFSGFNNPNFSLPNESLSFPNGEKRRFFYFDMFKKLKSVSSLHFLKHNPQSTFGKFTRTKYLCLVHPKMEASFSGNLKQRKMVSAWEWPETEFFVAFAEMARRVWVLHCLAFSFDKEMTSFEVRKNCRFSEVYMESVTDEVCSAVDDEVKVAFTVVPGFKIGKTMIQSQVYLSPTDY